MAISLKALSFIQSWRKESAFLFLISRFRGWHIWDTRCRLWNLINIRHFLLLSMDIVRCYFLLKWAHRYVPLIDHGLRFQYWWTNFQKICLFDRFFMFFWRMFFKIWIIQQVLPQTSPWTLSFQKKFYIPWVRGDH